MLDNKYCLLEYLYNSPRYENDEIEFCNRDISKCVMYRKMIRAMLKEEHPLIIRPVGTNRLRLTHLGISAYETEKCYRDRQTANEAAQINQTRSNNRFLVWSLVVTSVISLAGVIVGLLQIVL